MNKEGLEFNFVWFFAILAGVAILILAIYGAVTFGDTQRQKTDSEIAKSIDILIDPLQAGFSEGSFGKISFIQETRIKNLCFSSGFGENKISVASRSGVGEEWNDEGFEEEIRDKYIFSEEENFGEEFYVFSKPFYFPFKVSDLSFLISEKYCFVSVPEELKDEISGEVFEFDNCSSDSLSVCFNSFECDVNVIGNCVGDCGSFKEFGEGYVEKNGENFEYVGNLLFAAIFSEKEIYDCNVERLFFRTSKISDVLISKASLMNARGCNTNLVSDLVSFKSQLGSSGNLKSLSGFVRQLDDKNEKESCGLW